MNNSLWFDLNIFCLKLNWSWGLRQQLCTFNNTFLLDSLERNDLHYCLLISALIFLPQHVSNFIVKTQKIIKNFWRQRKLLTMIGLQVVSIVILLFWMKATTSVKSSASIPSLHRDDINDDAASHVGENFVVRLQGLSFLLSKYRRLFKVTLIKLPKTHLNTSKMPHCHATVSTPLLLHYWLIC